MTIFGKTVVEYLRFAAGVLAFVAVVGAARLVLSLAGVPVSAVRFFSVSGACLLGAVYLGAKAHASGFGGYRHLLPLMVMTLGMASWVSGLAVLLAIASGTDNVYSIPEYSGGQDGKTLFHAFAHFVPAPFVAGLVAWGPASLAMFVTKAAARTKRAPA